MTNIFNDLNLISPELYLILGSMLVLLTVSFCKNQQQKAALFLCFITASFALIILLFQAFNFFHEENATREMIFNSMLSVDRYSIFSRILILASGIVIILMMYAKTSVHKEKDFELPILALLSIAGMMLMVGCTSLISLYVSMEIMSLPLYILAASKRDNSISTEAGMKYFILGSLSSCLYLFGASLIYGFTGQLSFDGIFQAVDNRIDPALLFGIIFIITSFSFKISAVPFHMWTPDVYQGSPTIITSFFATAPKVASFTLFGRLLFDPFFGAANQWQQIVIFIALASMLIGSLGAIVQKNFKRLLAYSSIGHMGFALAGFASGEESGISSALIYIGIYVTMTLTIFSCILMLRRNGEEVENIYELNGLATNHPYMAFAIAVIMFSMAGVPPLAGFFAKFVVLQSLIANGLYVTSVIFVIASIIAAYYYLNLIKIIYFEGNAVALDKPFSLILISIATVGVIINLIYFVFPTSLFDIARSTVELFIRIV